MKIAVASDDGRRVSGHAGQARRWLIYAIAGDGAVGAPQALDLARDQVFHHHKDGPHPLDQVDVILTASAGDGFLRRMDKRGIRVVLTGEAEATQAVRDLLRQQVTPPPSRPLLKMVCKLRDLFSDHR